MCKHIACGYIFTDGILESKLGTVIMRQTEGDYSLQCSQGKNSPQIESHPESNQITLLLKVLKVLLMTKNTTKKNTYLEKQMLKPNS